MSDDTGVQSGQPARAREAPEALLERADAIYRRMNERLDSLTEHELMAPGLVGEWSGTILLAHLGRWTMAANEVIRDHLAGRVPTDYDDFEPWNQRWAAEDAGLSLQEARRRYAVAYEDLRALARGIPVGQWDATVRGWVKGSGIHHFEAHLEDLKEHSPET